MVANRVRRLMSERPPFSTLQLLDWDHALTQQALLPESEFVERRRAVGCGSIGRSLSPCIGSAWSCRSLRSATPLE